jgi:hypothetical protein
MQSINDLRVRRLSWTPLRQRSDANMGERGVELFGQFGDQGGECIEVVPDGMLSRDDVGVLGDLDEVLARGGHLGIGHGESVARSDVPISNRRRGA